MISPCIIYDFLSAQPVKKMLMLPFDSLPLFLLFLSSSFPSFPLFFSSDEGHTCVVAEGVVDRWFSLYRPWVACMISCCRWLMCSMLTAGILATRIPPTSMSSSWLQYVHWLARLARAYVNMATLQAALVLCRSWCRGLVGLYNEGTKVSGRINC